MVIDVMRNITISGKTPEQDQARVVERRRGTGAVRGVLEHEVHQRDDQAGHHEIIATLRWSAASWRRIAGGRREVGPRGSAGCGRGAVPDDGQKRFLQ